MFVPPWRQKTNPCGNYSQLTSLELQYVSPKLLMCRDLELAVPGTYDPNQPIIRIQSIAPSLQVITSKQRPRKLTLMGKYHYVRLPRTLAEPLPRLGNYCLLFTLIFHMLRLSRVYCEGNRGQVDFSLFHSPWDSSPS